MKTKLKMRLDKNIAAKVTIHNNNGKYIGSTCNSFDSVADAKSFVKNEYKGHGTIQVSISQEGDYYNSFKVKA